VSDLNNTGVHWLHELHSSHSELDQAQGLPVPHGRCRNLLQRVVEQHDHYDRSLERGPLLVRGHRSLEGALVHVRERLACALDTSHSRRDRRVVALAAAVVESVGTAHARAEGKEQASFVTSRRAEPKGDVPESHRVAGPDHDSDCPSLHSQGNTEHVEQLGATAQEAATTECEGVFVREKLPPPVQRRRMAWVVQFAGQVASQGLP